MPGIRRGLAGLCMLLALMAAPVRAQQQACGANGTLNNLELTFISSGQPQQLLCARENTPQTTRLIGNITGLMGGETIVGADYRPSDRMLIALTSASNLVSINPTTGVATLLTPNGLQTDGQRVQLSGSSFGVDFNPASLALRILGSDGVNRRVTPPVEGGATVTDGPLTAVDGMAPLQGVTAAAYTNNDRAPTTGTLLYGIDTNLDQLVVLVPPNAGTSSTIGALGLDIGPNASLDIFARSATANQPASPARALLVYQLTGQQTLTLGLVDLITGVLSNPRPLAASTQLVAMAIAFQQGQIVGN